MKRIAMFLVFLLTIFLLFKFTTIPVLAQTETPQVFLDLDKIIGFKSFGNQQIRVQGTFSLVADVSENIDRVVFYIDGNLMGEDDQPPFRYQFSSSSYPLGAHTFSAVGYTSDGKLIGSNQLELTFVTVAEAWTFGLKLLIPVAVIAMITIGLNLFGRNKKVILPAGTPRTYGVTGGTICCRCKRPFSLHIFAPDLFGRKLERCPYCGLISLVTRMAPEELKSAEAAELETGEIPGHISEVSDDEKFKKQVESAKYIKPNQ